MLHGEALLVVTAGDLEDVALELLAHKRTIELSSHASVVKGTAAMECHEKAPLPAWESAQSTYIYFSSSISIFF